MAAEDLKVFLKNRPYPGEKNSGDLPFYFHRENALLLGIVDGLGHGAKAHLVTLQIREHLEQYWHNDVLKMFTNLDRTLQTSIGAAIGMAYVDLLNGKMEYAAVGNTQAYVLGETTYRFISKDGVVGQQMRTPLLQPYQLTAGDKVISTTDGIQERFYNDTSHHYRTTAPETIVGSIVEDFGKKYDDASCLVFEF